MTTQLPTFDRLPALEGWAEVVAPPVKAKAGSPILVTVVQRKKEMILTVSLAAHIVEALGSPKTVSVLANTAEQALMIVPAAQDVGFKLTGFGKRLSGASTSARYVVRVPAWSKMSQETVAIAANGDVVEFKGGPRLVIRLPNGVFPSTGLAARRP